jgi:hypothetical protein
MNRKSNRRNIRTSRISAAELERLVFQTQFMHLISEEEENSCAYSARDRARSDADIIREEDIINELYELGVSVDSN